LNTNNNNNNETLRIDKVLAVYNNYTGFGHDTILLLLFFGLDIWCGIRPIHRQTVSSGTSRIKIRMKMHRSPLSF